MVVCKLNKRLYVTSMHGKGMHGRYSKILRQKGYGIADVLGKEASKYVLGGIGKTTGAYAGKALGKLIQEKTGNEMLGKLAKAGFSSLGGIAGQNIGKQTGKLLGNTVFSEKETKKKKKEEPETPKVSLSALLEQAKNKISGQQGNGLGYY